MKLYKVNILIDTDYTHLHKTCILWANDKNDAKEKAKNYVFARVHENYVFTQIHYSVCVENVTELTQNADGIIYDDLYE